MKFFNADSRERTISRLPVIVNRRDQCISSNNDANIHDRAFIIGSADSTANAALAAFPAHPNNRMTQNQFKILLMGALNIPHFAKGEWFCNRMITKNNRVVRCGAPMDMRGEHALVCPKNGLRATPHAFVLRTLRSIFKFLLPDCIISSSEPHYSMDFEMCSPCNRLQPNTRQAIPGDIDEVNPDHYTKNRADILIEGGVLCEKRKIYLDLTFACPGA